MSFFARACVLTWEIQEAFLGRRPSLKAVFSSFEEFHLQDTLELELIVNEVRVRFVVLQRISPCASSCILHLVLVNKVVVRDLVFDVADDVLPVRSGILGHNVYVLL